MNHEEHGGREGFTKGAEIVAAVVVDAGLKVHRTLGAGLLESAYEQCLAIELGRRGLDVQAQVLLPMVYEGVRIEGAYRLDRIVKGVVVIEVKSVDALSRVHEAQILTYLRLTNCAIGFLMNFNVPLFKQGLRRFVLCLRESFSSFVRFVVLFLPLDHPPSLPTTPTSPKHRRFV